MQVDEKFNIRNGGAHGGKKFNIRWLNGGKKFNNLTSGGSMVAKNLTSGMVVLMHDAHDAHSTSVIIVKQLVCHIMHMARVRGMLPLLLLNQIHK